MFCTSIRATCTSLRIAINHAVAFGLSACLPCTHSYFCSRRESMVLLTVFFVQCHYVHLRQSRAHVPQRCVCAFCLGLLLFVFIGRLCPPELLNFMVDVLCDSLWHRVEQYMPFVHADSAFDPAPPDVPYVSPPLRLRCYVWCCFDGLILPLIFWCALFLH